MGRPCVSGVQGAEELQAALGTLREQLRRGLAAVAAQSRANGRTLVRLAAAQNARRTLCARQEGRLAAREGEAARHRDEHAAWRKEYLAERADIWAAVNKLRFHVYVGIGAGLALQLLVPVVLRAALK